MPFGLCNATVTFQRLMAQALTNVLKKHGNLIMCYADDVVIAAPTLEDHIESLDEVFTCKKQAGLKCKPSKCEILRDSIKCLGRLVDKHGVRPGFANYWILLTIIESSSRDTPIRYTSCSS